MTSSDEKVLRIPMKDHLQNSPLPTDVTFVFHVFQGDRTKQRKHMHDVVFPAHRDRLIAASPYFESLLAGDWKHADEVSIEDCQPGAFRILLRWIYSDNAIIRPSTFIAVLLAAERFGMQELVNRLVGLAEQLLAVADSFFYKIINMLEHRQVGCANELTEVCLNFLDNNAVALMRQSSFLGISHERLMEIMSRNSLAIQEIDLYQAVAKWSRAQLKRANKRRTRRAMREVLGDALFRIRFPTMHPQEFTNGPAKDNILTAKEKLAIYARFYNTGPTSASNAFSAEPRAGTSTLPLRDFTSTYCQKCGTHLNGDTCAECGCSYHSSVECDECGTRLFVDLKAFAITYCSDEDCPGVAYRCSCGAPNATKEWGRCKCRRCGLKTWRCVEDGSVKERTCKCYECMYTCPEDYSDGELTFSEDSSDDVGDDEEGEDIDDEQ